jgi:transposase-like protein
MTNEELSVVWVELYSQGYSVEKIAKQFNKSTTVVYSWLKKKNVKLRYTKQVEGTWKDVPIEKARALYESGITVADIAREVGFHEGLVRYALRKNGVGLRRRNNPFTDEEAIRLYEQGNSMETIAEMFGVKRTKVRTALLINNTGIRHREPYDFSKCDNVVSYESYGAINTPTNYTKSPSKHASQSKIYTNENFFNGWSHELAYFLGWLASDGNVVEDKNVFRITSTDIEHLENLFSMFSHGWSTCIRKWRKPEHANYKPAGTISIARKDILDKIMNYGILPCKSLTIKMLDVPPQYLRDFVRGVFEGDGCINVKKVKRKSGIILCPKVCFASGSKDFLEGFGRAIEFQTGLKHYISVDKKGTYCLNYPSPTATEILFHYFYDGVPNTMILDRKWRTFVDYFVQRGGESNDTTDEQLSSKLSKTGMRSRLGIAK